jgi:two-component system, LytTR family, response regulator
MIRAVAIDDEPLSLKVLEEHSSKVNFLHLQGVFTNPLEGIEYVKKEKIPALFLDINMQDISGLEIVELLPPQTYIIFTTAYPEYAVKGFEVDAVDYLLKPVSFSRFLKACHRLKQRFEAEQPDLVLVLKDGSELIRVKTSDIYFIEAAGNYVKVHTSKGIFLHRQTVKELVGLLPPSKFLRTHKSYIVNIEHISRIETLQLTIDNQPIPLSPNYRDEVWNKLGIIAK